MYTELVPAVTQSGTGSAETTAIKPGCNHALIRACSTLDFQLLLCLDDFHRPRLNYSMIL